VALLWGPLFAKSPTNIGRIFSMAALLPRVKPQWIGQLRKYKLPLPTTPHLVLSSEDIKDCAIFIIGDVHGCLAIDI
jgi:hypothetical protein